MTTPTNFLTTTGSVIDVIELVSRAIRTAAELRSQWKEANLSVFLLESQLNALNDALTKVNTWAESDFHDPHHQLVMDLGRCIECCRMLVAQIEKKLSNATKRMDRELSFENKLKLVWKSKDIKRAQKTLDRQTNALTLLLTACNLYVVDPVENEASNGNRARISDQKNLLERRETRQILNRIEDDAVSLFVHRDAESFWTSLSGTTIRASKRSLRFDFDKELFVSKVYEKWIRGSVKKCLKDQQPDIAPPPRRPSSTEDLIQLLRCDPRRPHAALLLGDESRMEVLQLILSRYSQQDLFDYKSRVIQTVVDSVKSLVEAMQHAGVAVEDKRLWEQVEILAAHRFDGKPVYCESDIEFNDAVDYVLQHASVLCFMKTQADTRIICSAQYFLTQAKRIDSIDYVPNATDVLQYMANCTGVHRTKLDRLNIFAITDEKDARNELIAYFKNVTSAIFMMDMGSAELLGGLETDKIKTIKALDLFADLISKLRQRSSIIIIFTNIARKHGSTATKSELKMSLMEEKAERRVKFMRSLFTRLNAGKHALYGHYLAQTDHHAIECIKNSVSSTITANILGGFGID